MLLTYDSQNRINIEIYANYRQIEYNLNINWKPLEQSSPVKEYEHTIRLSAPYNLGIEHRSNGEDKPTSVSTNGIYVKFYTDEYKIKYYYSVYPKYRHKSPYRTHYLMILAKYGNVEGIIYWFSSFDGYKVEARYKFSEFNIVYKNGQGEFLGNFREKYHSIGLEINI